MKVICTENEELEARLAKMEEDEEVLEEKDAMRGA